MTTRLLLRSLNVFALGCALALAGCSRESGESAQPAAAEAGGIDRSHRGSELPEFVLKDFRGRDMRLSSLKGRPFLLNLWATWCAPCIAELPALDTLSTSGRVRVFLASQDIGEPMKVLRFLEQHGKHLENWLDPGNELLTHYRAESLPMTIYYDAAGREVWRFVGPREWGDSETAAMLAEAL